MHIQNSDKGFSRDGKTNKLKIVTTENTNAKKLMRANSCVIIDVFQCALQLQVLNVSTTTF